MGKAKIAVIVDEDAIAMQERIAKVHRSRLARECAKLDPSEEQALADEVYVGQTEWVEY
jgi:hypothetical protein